MGAARPGYRRFLIFPNDGIGDCVQISPVFEIIKLNYPKSQITVVSYTSDQFRILTGNPFVDHLVMFNRAEPVPPSKMKILKLILLMYAHDIAIYAINPNNLSSAIGAAFDFYRKRKIILSDFDRGLDKKYESVSSKIFHIYQNELVTQLDIPCNKIFADVYAFPSIGLTRKNQDVAEAFVKKHNLRKFAVIAQDSTLAIKTLPDEVVRIAKVLLKEQGLQVVKLAGIWNARSASKDDIFFEDPDIKNVAALLSKATTVVTCDSGIAHISAALDVNTITIFGPSNSDLYGPFGHQNVFVIEKTCNAKKIKGYCTACEHKTYQKEKLGAACLHWISLDEMITATDYF